MGRRSLDASIGKTLGFVFFFFFSPSCPPPPRPSAAPGQLLGADQGQIVLCYFVVVLAFLIVHCYNFISAISLGEIEGLWQAPGGSAKHRRH